MQRFKLVEGTSSKFWEVVVEGTTLRVNFGRIGTRDQSKEHELDSFEVSIRERDRLVRQKRGKGYNLVAESLDEEVDAVLEPAAPESVMDDDLAMLTDLAPAPSATAAPGPDIDSDPALSLALPTRSHPRG